MEETKPLVSFIIPIYNVPIELLRQCLDSICALSLRPAEREIIVVDDGSSESPMRQLTDYNDNIIYIRKPNGGLSSARNLGLQMASGRFIQFVDGDDSLQQRAYEHVLDIARYSQSDLVMFSFIHQPHAESDYEDIGPVSGQELMHTRNIHGSAWGYVFSRSILGELRFSPGIYHEDEEFTPLLLLRAESVYQTTAEAYLYQKRPGSITTTDNIRHKLKRINDFKAVIVRLSQTANTLPTQKQTALQRRVAQLTMDFIYKVIVETRSRHYLDRQLESLHSQGLFPLPDRDYTTKYTWFRRMTNSSMGRFILLRILPLMERER